MWRRIWRKGLSTLRQRSLGVPFKSYDVLADSTLRQGVKEFTNWPTVPQLYVRGEFIGGCDIVREMYGSGELQKLLQEQGVLAG